MTTSLSVTDPAKAAHQPTPTPRKQKVIAKLERGREVTLTGINPTIDELIVALAELSKRAIAAKRQNLSLQTFLAILSDQSVR